MSDYSCLYTTATGEIVAIAETADLPAAGAGQSIYAGDADINEHYILAGVRTDRPLLPFYTTTAPATLGTGEATNLCLRSQEFDNASWIGTMTRTADAIAAPDGTTTADTLTYASADALYQTITVIASTAYVFSYYVKLGTKIDNRYAIYDATGAAFIVAATSATGVSSGAWTRISVAFTTPVGCVSIRAYPDRADSPNTTGTIYLWGAQLELGSVATDYITTTTAVVTRLYFDDAEEYPISSDGVDAVTVGLPSGTVVTDLSDSVDYTSSGVENLVVTSAIVGKFDFFINPPFPYKTIALRVNANDHL